MRIDDFEKALDRHGGDLADWPETLRAEAQTLIARSAAAAALATRAARLDNLLAEAMRPAPVDAALIGRVVAGLGNGVHHEATFRPTPRLAAWAGAATIAFLSAGYAAGLILPTSQGEDTLAGLMFGGDWTTDTDTADAGSLL